MTDWYRSFCRKTTLTKHFRRWHTDEEISSEEGSDIGPDDFPEDVPTTRRTSYYGDLWPLPGQSAQQSRPATFQTTLVSRPKSTESVKVERNTPISPLSDHSIQNANGGLTSFEFMGASSEVTPDQILTQAIIPANFTSVPVSRQYTSENGVETWTSPTDTKTAHTFSDYSPTPSGGQSNPLFFSDATSPTYPVEVANIHLGEPIQYTQDAVAVISNSVSQLYENMSHGSLLDQRYALGPTSAPEQPLQFSAVPLMAQQQQSPMTATFDGHQYVVLDNPTRYYTQMPDWYPNIKPEESWHGPLPSQMTEFYQ